MTLSEIAEPKALGGGPIDFRGPLAVLGFIESEYVSVCHIVRGGRFLTEVCSPHDAPTLVAALPESADVYFGVCPVVGPSRTNQGRGKAEDVTRLSALWVDLDITAGKCDTDEIAAAIIGDLSDVLGVRPAAVTSTGHGLHPYWPVADGDLGSSFDRGRAVDLLRYWKSVVNDIAESHGAKADSVFDLARVLRVPGTHNNKETL